MNVNRSNGEYVDEPLMRQKQIIKENKSTLPKDEPVVSAENLKNRLDEICQWIMRKDLGSGKLKNVEENFRSAICDNGGLARVLVAGSIILDKPSYLEEAIIFFDFLGKNQKLTKTSRGNIGGWWEDTEISHNIYLADIGFGLSAMAMAYPLVKNKKRKLRYHKAMGNFVRFVLEGCKDDPQGLSRGGCKSFVLPNGAFGLGYYKKRNFLSLQPYSISTMSVGTLFFSLYYKLFRNRLCLKTVKKAGAWLATTMRKGGYFELVRDGEIKYELPYTCAGYGGEGLMCAYENIQLRRLRKLLAEKILNLIEWLVRTHNKSGLWGGEKPLDGQWGGGFDATRCLLCLPVLNWGLNHGLTDTKLENARQQTLKFILDKNASYPYGICRLQMETMFAGLALADTLKPGVTISIPQIS